MTYGARGKASGTTSARADAQTARKCCLRGNALVYDPRSLTLLRVRAGSANGECSSLSWPSIACALRMSLATETACFGAMPSFYLLAHQVCRAVCDQLDGSPEKHQELRHRTVDFIELHQDDFAPFVEDDEPFESVCTMHLQNQLLLVLRRAFLLLSSSSRFSSVFSLSCCFCRSLRSLCHSTVRGCVRMARGAGT